MNIAFFGTGKFSRNILESLLEYSDVTVKFVVSQPDKKVGRKNELQVTPLKELALNQGITVLQPHTLKNDTSILELSREIDFFIVVAYGKIIPLDILNIPKLGSINLHGSLLPSYRGASPVQESLKKGDAITGLTSMYMSAGMDEGDILLQEEIVIASDDTQVEVFNNFEASGGNLLYKTMIGIIDASIKSTVQDEALVSYCKKIEKHDGKIDFTHMKSSEVYNLYRAYTPWPGIHSQYNGKKINFEECSHDIHEIEIGSKKPGDVLRLDKKTIGILCKDNTFLQLKKVKLEGKKTMNILDFINGNTDFLNYSF